MRTYPEIEMLLCVILLVVLAFIAMYALIRKSVRDGISDAIRRQAIKITPADEDDPD